MTRPPAKRTAWFLMVCFLLVACAGPTDTSGSASELPGSTAVAASGRLTPSPTSSSPRADPSAAATYPPSYTGHGPAPLYDRAVTLEDGDSSSQSAAAHALQQARDRLRVASSYEFWMSIAAAGPAAEGLETDEPLVLAGTVIVGPPEAAAYSFTSLLGYPRRTIRYTVVGATVWCDSGVGYWTVFDGAEAELARADAATLQPGAMFATTFLDGSVDLAAAGTQQIGPELGLRLEAADPESVPLSGWWLGLEGEVRSFVLWVTAEGIPLQAEVAGVVHSGSREGPFRLLLQIGAIDDPDNAVAPPI